MDIKGLNKLEKKLQKVVDMVNPKIKLKLGGQDCCIVEDKIVYFSILREYYSDRAYIDNLYSVYKDAPQLPVFLYSLLHEIGHIYTEYAWEEEDMDYRKKISKAGDNEKYFLLPAEKAATEWAVSYVRKYPKKTRRMAMDILKAMEVFLKANISQ